MAFFWLCLVGAVMKCCAVACCDMLTSCLRSPCNAEAANACVCWCVQSGDRAAVADLGGSIITGIHSNPLAVLARQLGIPLHDINAKVPLFLKDGSELRKETEKEVGAGQGACWPWGQLPWVGALYGVTCCASSI